MVSYWIPAAASAMKSRKPANRRDHWAVVTYGSRFSCSDGMNVVDTWNTDDSTTGRLVKNMPASFDGAIAWTFSRYKEPNEGYPEQPVDRACRDTYNRVTGENHPYGETNPIGFSCGSIRLFEAIVNLTGANPTRASWKDAVQRLTNFQYPFMFGGTFGPDDFFSFRRTEAK